MAESLAWRACFLDWGVSCEDNPHSEIVELFKRAKDVSPSYIVHYALAKVTCDAPTTRDGIPEWFSCLLNAGTLGIPASVAQPLCRVRRAHVLTVITAAYAKQEFNLPQSVNAGPTALRVGLQERSPYVMPPSRDPPCAPSSPGEPLRAKHIAPVSQNVNIARCRLPKALGKSVVKSAARVEEVKKSDAKGRHDRTMVRMMTAVGIMLEYYNPDAKLWPSVLDVFRRRPLSVLKGMSEPSIGLLLSSWRWTRRGSKNREERTYDRLHALALTKPGVTSAVDALQYVQKLHKVMMSDPFWRYKHLKRRAGSFAIPWQQW